VPKIALTDLAIRSLDEGVYFDTRLPAFGIRVGKHRKTWLVVKGKGRTKVRLGHYPAISLSDARRRAHIALGTPFQERTAPTFRDARDEFLDQDRWRPRSKSEIIRLLHRHFDWTKRVDQITHTDVLEAIERISAPSEAAHAFKDLKTFFNWCVPRYLTHSPMAGLDPPSRYVPRERVLTDEELKAVWKASEPMGNYGVLVRLLILTGQRVGQYLPFSQAWVQNDAVVFPASVMKGKREHIIPVTPLAAELLGKLDPCTYQGKPKLKLDEASGVTAWTLHDLRRTFATNLAALRTPIHVTEKLLNHVSGTVSGVAAIYNRHTYMDEMRAAIEAWEGKLINLVGDEQPNAR